MGYGFSHQDVAGVTGSLDNLSQTLLKKRMLAQQDEQMANQVTQQGVQNELSRQQIGIHRDQLKMQGDWHQAAIKSQEGQVALKKLQDAYVQIADDYKSGIITKDKANARGREIVQRIRDGSDAIISNSPFAAMLTADGDLFSDIPTKPMASHTSAATIEDARLAELKAAAQAADDAGEDSAALWKRADDFEKRIAPRTPPGPMDREERTLIPGQFGEKDKEAVKKVTYTKPGEKPVAAANVTEAEYKKLKKGDLYWWDGKQISKQ